MNSLLDYINSWFYTQQNNDNNDNNDNIVTSQEEKQNNDDIVCLISPKDLINIKLKPTKNIIPSPARNMPPVDKFYLANLNKAQLKEILNVKLKPIPTKDKFYNKVTKYEPKHPVLRELLQKQPIII